MKKLLVLLALAVVLCVPELCYLVEEYPLSNNPSSSYNRCLTTKEFEVCRDTSSAWRNTATELDNVVGDLKGFQHAKDIDGIVSALQTIKMATVLYMYSSDILLFSCGITELRLGETMFPMVAARLKLNKASILNWIELLGIGYSQLETPAALHLVDKARDTIRSSLPLFDKPIQLLESKKP